MSTPTPSRAPAPFRDMVESRFSALEKQVKELVASIADLRPAQSIGGAVTSSVSSIDDKMDSMLQSISSLLKKVDTMEKNNEMDAVLLRCNAHLDGILDLPADAMEGTNKGSFPPHQIGKYLPNHYHSPEAEQQLLSLSITTRLSASSEARRPSYQTKDLSFAPSVRIPPTIRNPVIVTFAMVTSTLNARRC